MRSCTQLAHFGFRLNYSPRWAPTGSSHAGAFPSHLSSLSHLISNLGLLSMTRHRGMHCHPLLWSEMPKNQLGHLKVLKALTAAEYLKFSEMHYSQEPVLRENLASSFMGPAAAASDPHTGPGGSAGPAETLAQPSTCALEQRVSRGGVQPRPDGRWTGAVSPEKMSLHSREPRKLIPIMLLLMLKNAAIVSLSWSRPQSWVLQSR